jgi:hypothetical protein
MAEVVLGVLEGVDTRDATSAREWWSPARFPAWAYILSGDLETAERLAREAVDAGEKEEYWRLNDIAIHRGEPSPPELMAEIAEKGPDGPDMWGGDAWYHVAREAAAAGDQASALEALRAACEYWRNPPLQHLTVWENDARWGALRDAPEFKGIIAEKRRRIGPVHGMLWYFPAW